MIKKEDLKIGQSYLMLDKVIYGNSPYRIVEVVIKDVNDLAKNHPRCREGNLFKTFEAASLEKEKFLERARNWLIDMMDEPLHGTVEQKADAMIAQLRG